MCHSPPLFCFICIYLRSVLSVTCWLLCCCHPTFMFFGRSSIGFWFRSWPPLLTWENYVYTYVHIIDLGQAVPIPLQFTIQFATNFLLLSAKFYLARPASRFPGKLTLFASSFPSARASFIAAFCLCFMLSIYAFYFVFV